MKTPFNFRAILLAGAVLALTACASQQQPLSQLVTSGERGAVLAAFEVTGDFDQGSRSNGQYPAIYDFAPIMITRAVLDGSEQPTRSKTSGAVLEKTETKRSHMLWRVYPLEPGEYVLNGFLENALPGKVFREQKVTWFTGLPKLDSTGDPVLGSKEGLPQLTVHAGEVVYVGKFDAQITTWVYRSLFTSNRLKDAMRSYSFSRANAESVVKDTWLAGLKMTESNLFAGKPAALAKFEKPWVKRGTKY